jgi:protein TonB
MMLSLSAALLVHGAGAALLLDASGPVANPGGGASGIEIALSDIAPAPPGGSPGGEAAPSPETESPPPAEPETPKTAMAEAGPADPQPVSPKETKGIEVSEAEPLPTAESAPKPELDPAATAEAEPAAPPPAPVPPEKRRVPAAKARPVPPEVARAVPPRRPLREPERHRPETFAAAPPRAAESQPQTLQASDLIHRKAPSPVRPATGTPGGSGAPTGAEAEKAAPPGRARGSAAQPGVPADYLDQLRAWLERHKEYPRSARLRQQEGTVRLRFAMDGTGAVLSYKIVESSGISVLDRAVEEMVARAQPLPARPGPRAEGPFEIVIPVRFVLR